MTTPTTTKSTADTTTRFDYEIIKLPNHFFASVLTGCRLVTPATVASTRLPAAQEWLKPLTQLVTNPDALPTREMLKHSKTAQVFRTCLTFAHGPIDVICKRTQNKGLSQRLVNRFFHSRGRANLNRAVQLLRAGINTALPLALVERTVAPQAAWLITEAIPDAVDLDQVTLMLLPQLSRQRAGAVKKALIAALVEFLHRMESCGLHHRDLKASNFLITNWDSTCGTDFPTTCGTGSPTGQSEPRIWIVDLDGLSSHRPLSGRARRQPLMRLAASLLSYPTVTRTDYARFLKDYLSQTGTPQDQWKRRFRELRQRASTYVHRARRRKRHKLDGYTGDA